MSPRPRLMSPRQSMMNPRQSMMNPRQSMRSWSWRWPTRPRLWKSSAGVGGGLCCGTSARCPRWTSTCHAPTTAS
eukprot:4613971-Pyramimonas_sp.AAC.1